MNLVMLSGAKTIGLLYLIIFPIAYLLYNLYCKKNIKNIFEYISIFILCIILFVVCNLNPYFTNIFKNKHPLYPLAGKEKIDIIKNVNTPVRLQHKNYFYKTIVGIFTSTQDGSKKLRIKVPFSVVKQMSLGVTDMRLGGFGYFWSGILLLVLGYLVTDKIRTKEKPKKEEFLLWFILLTVFLNPENWWARYVPQFWIVPLFIVLYSLNNEKISKYKKYFLYLILVLITINNLIIIFQVQKQANYYASQIRKFLRAIKKAPMVYIYEDKEAIEQSIYEKLKEKNIKYTTISNEDYEKNKDKFIEIPYAINPPIKYATECEGCSAK